MENSVSEKKCGRHIVQYDPDISLCAGCGACEIVCGLIHDGKVGDSYRRIYFHHDPIQLMHKVYACQQCEDHPCYNACPKKDKAMCIDPETGVVYVNEEGCIGCKLCVKACPFEPKRIQVRDKKAIKCDLCRGRKNGPACVEYCQCMAIGLSDAPIPEGITPYPLDDEEEAGWDE
jgi:Fe-S-cluster-containing hydrogenase component 2